MKTINNAQITEIQRIVNGETTSKDAVCRMYGLTPDQLQQVMNHKVEASNEEKSDS
jgi:hypothetical protein